MPALGPDAIAALLRAVGLPAAQHEIMEWLTAIALAESGGEVGMVRGDRRGLWLINDSRGFDRQRMVTDAAYAAARAVEISEGGRNLTMWPTWNSGDYQRFLNAATLGVAKALAVSGSILAEDGSYVPPSSYGAAAPAATYTTPAVTEGAPVLGGVGAPITASFEQQQPLSGLRITGTELTGDLANVVIGEPGYEAGFGTVPNLQFVIADPQGDLLWQKRNLWVVGARVQYLDLDLRIDEIKFAPGGHTTGQIEISAVDALVYSLQKLTGARAVKNQSPDQFIAQEVRLAGWDPALFYLGERLPSQADIARDVPDANSTNNATSSSDVPSAWSTILRLAKEQGRRAFISGRKLIFGSTQFAVDWAAPGDLRIGWHESPEGERWLNLPTATSTRIGNRDVTQVEGTIPLNRARFFRPGVSVIVHNTPSVAAGDRRFVCSNVSFTLSRDTDGAQIQLVEPVDPEKEAKA